jgi:hypothetical protein
VGVDQKIIKNVKMNPIPTDGSMINKILPSKKAQIKKSLRPARKAEPKPPPTIRIKKEKKKVDPTDYQKVKAGEKVDNYASDQLRTSMEK